MDSQWLPAWSTVEKIESGGRYPLGLNSFHNGLDEILIKSITETANRLRYISYYCWVIGDIHKNNENLDYVDFINNFWIRENALTIGFYLLQPSYPYNGNQNSNVRSSLEKNECNLDFQLMRSNSLGAFGLFYIGTMQNLGLIAINNKGIYSLTEAGTKLYEVYEKFLLKKGSEYHDKYTGKKIIPSNVLLEWGKTNDLNNINDDSCIDERNIYKSLLFHLDKKQTIDFRRQTFCLFLECINQCHEKDVTFSEEILKTINYYGNYLDAGKSLQEFNLPSYLSDAYYYWTIYEGHGYFRGWLERYFQVFLEFLKSQGDGATFEDFFSSIDKKEFNRIVSDFSGESKDFFNQPLEKIFNLYKEDVNLGSSISEESLFQNERIDNWTVVLVKFVFTMVAIMVKFEKFRHNKQYLFIENQRLEDLWFDRLYFIPSLKKMTINDFLRKCLKDYIINQHDIVMFKKHDLRRCWFTKEQDKYFFEAEVRPNWRPAKYRTIMNFLSDMNLIRQKEGKYELTIEGTNFYEALKKEYFNE